MRFLDSVASQASQNIIESIDDLKEGTIVGDNIDLVIKPRHHRLAAKDQSCHWYNTDYVVDRVKTEHLSTTIPKVIMEDLQTNEWLLLNTLEETSIKSAMGVIIGRIAAEYLPCFSWMVDVLPKHIPHRYEYFKIILQFTSTWDVVKC